MSKDFTSYRITTFTNFQHLGNMLTCYSTCYNIPEIYFCTSTLCKLVFTSVKLYLSKLFNFVFHWVYCIHQSSENILSIIYFCGKNGSKRKNRIGKSFPLSPKSEIKFFTMFLQSSIFQNKRPNNRCSVTHFSSTIVWSPFISSIIIFSSSAINMCGLSNNAENTKMTLTSLHNIYERLE